MIGEELRTGRDWVKQVSVLRHVAEKGEEIGRKLYITSLDLVKSIWPLKLRSRVESTTNV